MLDRILIRVVRVCLHLMSNEAAWRHYQIERQFWTSEAGMVLMRKLIS